MCCSPLNRRHHRYAQRTNLIGLASPAVLQILIIAVHYGCCASYSSYRSHHEVHGGLPIIITAEVVPLDGQNKSHDHLDEAEIKPPGNHHSAAAAATEADNGGDDNDTHIFTSDT